MTPDELRLLADEAKNAPQVVIEAKGPIHRSQARLIVLAPDLARLCAELGEALERISGRGKPMVYDQIEALARAALAKLSELEAKT